MRILFIILTIISINCFSQNRDSYISEMIRENIYQYYDSLGVSRLEEADTCECGEAFESKFWIFSVREDAYDSLLLNVYADDNLIDLLTIDYLKYLKKFGRPQFNEVYLELDIIQKSNRFNIFRWKRKVKYKMFISINYKPTNEKKTN